MQIFIFISPLLILCYVLGFHEEFLKSLFGILAVMDPITFFKHLTLDCEFRCASLFFKSIQQVLENWGLFLLFAIGFMFLNSDLFSSILVRFLCDFRENSEKFTNGFSSEIHFNRKFSHEDQPLISKIKKVRIKPNIYSDSDLNYDADNEENGEFDVPSVTKLLKIENHRSNTALIQLEKEREASATAAAEVMAMILRLENEKSMIQMESTQYRRLAEEKNIHDQKVIQSLQWLVRRQEYQLKSCKRMLVKGISGSDESETICSFNGDMWDDLENVLYSSSDATKFST